MSTRTRSGLSFIELLVVVAIIATIAALLIPGLRQMRDAAQSAACRGNLRQITLGSEGYIQDNRGYLAPSRMYFTGGPITTLREFLDPYIDTGSTNPDTRTKRILWVCPGRMKSPIQNPMDYGGNLNLHVWWEPAFAGGGDAKKQRPVHRGMINDLAGSVAFADVAQASGAGTGIGIIAYSDLPELDANPARLYDQLWAAQSQLNGPTPDRGAYTLRYRHASQRGCGVAWLDGHADIAQRYVLAGRNFTRTK